MKKRFLIRTMVLAFALSMSVFAGCGKSDKKDDSNTMVSAEQVDVSVAGTYVYSYTEEFDGEVIELSSTIVLKDDHTCELTFQDTVEGKWDGSKFTLDNGNEYEYKLEDGNLNLNQDGTWITFLKEE